MSAPVWAGALLRFVSPRDMADEVAGDLDEAHAERVKRSGRIAGTVGTVLETVDMAGALLRERIRRRRLRRARQPGGEEGRWAGMKFSELDFKLGLRMLAKYPGLTLVGGLAMAFAIWVGAGTFELVTQAVSPTLPLQDGSRVVGVRLWDAAAAGVERQALHDLTSWRGELKSIEDLGAFRTVRRNLSIGAVGTEPVEAAEMHAAGFRTARAAPLLGRVLRDADEEAGAPDVAVIGYDLWQRRFGGDAGVIGRSVQIGRTHTTIVGVMPEGFGFPVAHQLWVPLRLDVLEYERRQGPSIQMFGRLASGVSLEQAQAELAAVGARTAAAFPDTHEHLRPQVMPYAESILPMGGAESVLLMSSNIFLIMLMVLVCANVALLMFARATTRESEIVVRTALGASRGRIIAQLFAEALVLGTFATVAGLAAVSFGIRWAFGVVQAEMLDGGRLPFWFHAGLSPRTLLYAAILTVMGAIVAGVLPALKVTRGLQARLRETAAGGTLGFGGIWTLVIVAQIAVTVAFPVTGFFVQRDVTELEMLDVNFAESQYLSARLEMDRESADGQSEPLSAEEFGTRFEATFTELERRLAADAAVAGVTYADRLPRMYHPYRLIEVDGGGAAPLDASLPWSGYRVTSASVAPDYFSVLEAPVLAGRGFRESDVASGSDVVVVNASFVERVLGGRNPIGRRLRYTEMEEDDGPLPDSPSQPWYEIIGVVPDMGLAPPSSHKAAGFYHPAAPRDAYPVQMAVHVMGDAHSFAPRLREIAAAVDPTLRIYDPVPVEQLNQGDLMFLDFWLNLIVLVSSIALLLSLAGIYAVMAFTVSRRTREIGIRVALGSDRARVVAAVLSRPLTQVGFGILAGVILVLALALMITGGSLTARQSVLIGAYALGMTGVCMLACIVPARRALAVQPTEAMRADG